MPYPPAGFSPDMTATNIYHEIVKSRCGSMFRLLEAIIGDKPLETGFIEWEFAFGAALRLQMLGVSAPECGQLLNLICQRQWERSPTLFWHSRLCAQIEFEQLCSKGKGTWSNDHFDLSRLAVGLVDADVVLCDRSVSNLVEKTGLDAPPHFRGRRVMKPFATWKHSSKIRRYRPRWRTASKRVMIVAMATLRESAWPAIGMRT
jgi:hypothetical protein